MSNIHEQNIDNSHLTIFDDTKLPVSRISAQESDRIESIFMPLLEEELQRLRISKPHLFAE